MMKSSKQFEKKPKKNSESSTELKGEQLKVELKSSDEVILYILFQVLIKFLSFV